MRFIAVVLGFSIALPLLAEPWLGIRFAQNCAACHAPGRINLPAMDRRCTLSCQGCHVSPQGGGLRSFYGKWNENRWLRSFAIALLKPKSAFAAVEQQKYGSAAATQVSAVQRRTIEEQGYPLVAGDDLIMTDATKFKRDGLEYRIAQNKYEFLRQVPDQDPYRLFMDSKIDGGGSLRYQLVHTPKHGDSKSATHLFLMSADLALRWRPLYRNLHLVFEHRGIGFPSVGNGLKKSFMQVRQLLETSWTRSLYLLVDNLPFNSYVMAGLYRPLFGGNPSPDHTALLQRTLSKHLGQTGSYHSRFRAVSIGTAPNVPYANLHFIVRDESGRYDKNDRTRGIAANAGLRFVTYGLNSTYSFWYTENKHGGNKRSTLANSAALAGQLWRSTLMLEYMNLHTNKTNTQEEDTINTQVFEADSHTRLWREFYLVAQYALAQEKASGTTHYWHLGTRAFLMAGLDFGLRYAYWKSKSQAARRAFSAQLHLYF